MMDKYPPAYKIVKNYDEQVKIYDQMSTLEYQEVVRKIKNEIGDIRFRMKFRENAYLNIHDRHFNQYKFENNIKDVNEAISMEHFEKTYEFQKRIEPKLKTLKEELGELDEQYYKK